MSIWQREKEKTTILVTSSHSSGKRSREGVRNWLRRLLNPPQHQESDKTPRNQREEKPPSRQRDPRIRIPVFKSAVLALVSYAAYFLYQHRPDIKLTMIAPSEFPKLQIDSTPVKFDTQKLRFSDVKFQEPPQLNVGKLQFGPPPQSYRSRNCNLIHRRC